MLEKLLLFGITTLVGVVGYFMHRTLNSIERKQDEHTQAVRRNTGQVEKLKTGQLLLGKGLAGVQQKINHVEEKEAAARTALRESFGHLEAEMRILKHNQAEQNLNLGKVFTIAQKLHERTKD